MAKAPKSMKIKVDLDTSLVVAKIRKLQGMQDTFTLREKQAIAWLVFAIVFYIAENTYFGWNKEAQSIAEQICDMVVIGSFIMTFLWRPIRHEHTEFNIGSRHIL